MKKSAASFLLLILLLMAASGFASTLLLRFPAIHGDQVVFTYAGNLYAVASQGGIARPLTSDAGYEMFARFSPDGRQIAFTGQYDGNTEVYLIPAAGGVPQRLTYTATLERDEVSDRMGPNSIVMGWTPDGGQILFRSRMREFNDFKGQLYLVPSSGGMPEQLPLPRGGFGSFSPDGRQFAYNRIFREFRTWKRYRGGMADDIWIYDRVSKKTRNLTNDPASDLFPMWAGERIYFLSDRDESKRMNLFVCNSDGSGLHQLTRNTDYDIKFPSLGDQAIVFEKGGALFRFDLASETLHEIPVTIAADLAASRSGFADVSGAITNYEIAPDGQRALFGARGDLFTVPAKYGEIRNLSRTPGIHERNSVWSPDGRWIAALSDRTGEDEIWLFPQDGKGEPRQITRNSDVYKYRLSWSPDSRKLLWADKKLRLQYVDIESQMVTLVDTSRVFEFSDYTWSPGSQWIAYARPEEQMMSRLYLYSLETRSATAVTDGWFDCSDPAFSSDGLYLYFVSERDFNPLYSQVEWNHIYRDLSRIYLMTLSKETPSPFQPKSDEVQIKSPVPQPAEKAKKESAVVVTPRKIDLDGLAQRVVGLPIAPAQYGSLTALEQKLYYIRRGSKDEKPLLLMYDLKEQKETELGQIDGYEVSANQKKMLVKQAAAYAIIDLPAARIEIKDKLDLAGMEVALDRKAEWRQIFDESWRQMRDFFYAPNMHGVDWKGVKEKYGALVDHVAHRADLTYLIGEMIGELNSGHTYVGGGDLPKLQRVKLGLLGAQISKDAQSGYFRIDRILKGENWQTKDRSPLADLGVAAASGDYILAIDGQSTARMANLYAALVNKAGKQVVLTLNKTPQTAGSHDATVVPIESEAELYYYDWVQNNIARVTQASGGQVGYLHIPDMGTHGLNEFVKYYYPQLQKKALIIDDRGNGGGNVSPMIIERLRREITMFTFARNTVAAPAPDGMLWGPKICLIDEFSASDGDLFPYQFKQLKLGKLVGKRTWGGVVGIRGSLPFIDGGSLNKPEFSRFGLDGQSWIIEGHGVDPDVWVDNDPALEYSGVDQQLDTAIALILEEMKTWKNSVPPVPPYPER
ncbi:MAG TPA: PDZ domain-containing protein [bacterium]|nr:PDZ domain-containing protein [bacterium]HPR86460.1 PDZ domain-containing protein [bacterium]